MRFIVHVAKDGTPYFDVEQDHINDTPKDARRVAEDLMESFNDWPYGKHVNKEEEDSGKRSSFEILPD